MGTTPENGERDLPSQEEVVRLIHQVPGIVSVAMEGPHWAISEIRVWYEPTWPVGEVVQKVRACLAGAPARLAVARVRAVVAEPERRARPRARPEGNALGSVGLANSHGAGLKLIAHEVKQVGPGVVGVEVWIDIHGRIFSGAATGPDNPPGSLQTPALAALRAVHAGIQVLYPGARLPGLALDRAVEIVVGPNPVAIVTLTASENAQARFLTAAWADEGDMHLAVIFALLQASSRTVTRWLGEWSGPEPERAPQRLSLVGFEVAPDPSGRVDVGVRLAGFGEAVDRRASSERDRMPLLSLAASVTLDAVHDFLTMGGWCAADDVGLQHAGAHRLTTGDHDLVVVLAEASIDGHRFPLAGATSADAGVERASITAALQATNALVARSTSDHLPRLAGGGARAAALHA